MIICSIYELQEYNHCHDDEGQFCSGAGLGPLPSGFLEGSLYKDSLYHASNAQLTSGLRLDVTGAEHPDGYVEGEYGIYLQPSRRGIEMYGRHVYETRVNIQKPLYIDSKDGAFDGASVLRKHHVDMLRAKGYDSIVVGGKGDPAKADEVIILDPARVWVTHRDGKWL